MKMKKKRKGFTLVELLVTIFLVSLAIGISGAFVNNIINKSNIQKEELALNNIKKTASTYIEEYPNDIIWIKEENISYSCVSTNLLLEKGYFSKKDLKNRKISSYIIVKKNQANAIISEEFDDNTSPKCNNNKTIVKIPDSKEYCSNLEYSGDSQILTLPSPKEFSLENKEGIEAGNYKVKATLNNTEQYIWKDYTSTPKTIICSIKKATPLLWISDEDKSQTNEIGKKIIHLKSSIDGKISIKSSNKTIATASFNDGNNNISKSNEEDSNNQNSTSTAKEVTISINSTKESLTYITFELTPNDNTNYKKTTLTYTIGKVKKVEVPIPTCQENLYDKGIYQHLISLNQGYTLLNNFEKNSGNYTVTALLKYGYIWEDKSTDSKKIQCSIKSSVFKLSYDSNGGTICNPSSKEVRYNQKYGTLCTPSKSGHDFVGWNEKKDGTGKTITENTDVAITSDHTIYAKWLKKYTVTYDSNGGSACNPGTKTIVENGTYGSLCSPNKPGFQFDGWYTSASGGSKVESNSKVQNKNHTIYAHWTQTDKTAPTCGKQDPSVTDWTKESRTITVKCSDKGGAGCEKDSYSKTFSESGKEVNTDTITIKDKAGNEKKCKITVKVDKKAPVVSTNVKRNYSYQDDKTYCTERKQNRYQILQIVRYYDNGSGLKKSDFTWPKGCIGCDDSTGNQTSSRNCNKEGLKKATVTEGICGRNGIYTYKICDMVGNCAENEIKLPVKKKK